MRKSIQLMKTYNGYAITYHADRKGNNFVVTYHGKVVKRYADFYSCVSYLMIMIPNFDSITFEEH